MVKIDKRVLRDADVPSDSGVLRNIGVFKRHRVTRDTLIFPCDVKYADSNRGKNEFRIFWYNT